MARGWESKSVEQQQAEMADHRPRSGTAPTPAERQSIRKRDGLLLSRTCLAEQLKGATHPLRRQMLQDAIAEIDRQLSCIE
jgi:hypothetical protein